MEVIIDNVVFVPRCEIKPLDDRRLLECLSVLTEIRYFDEKHKAMGLVHHAIEILTPELAQLEPVDAYDRVRSDLEELELANCKPRGESYEKP